MAPHLLNITPNAVFNCYGAENDIFWIMLFFNVYLVHLKWDGKWKSTLFKENVDETPPPHPFDTFCDTGA